MDNVSPVREHLEMQMSLLRLLEGTQNTADDRTPSGATVLAGELQRALQAGQVIRAVA